MSTANSELESIRLPVKQEIAAFENFFQSAMQTNIPLLRLIVNYILRRKGKQIRPLFVFLTAKMLGDINRSAYVAASLIEMLHTATLVHDDVVDESDERRGVFSINALWKSKLAVLMGDFLLSKGLLVSVENNEYDMLRVVSEAVKDMIEGEFLQLQKSRLLNITEEEYFTVIKKKTASLISSSTQCGAIAAGANRDIVFKMKLFGEKAGMAFQIKDDLLDYESNGLTGKPQGNDIQQKKLTLPIIHCLNNLPPNERRQLKKLIRTNNTHKKFNEILKMLEKTDGINYAYNTMLRFKNEAIMELEGLPDNEAKSSLIRLVEFTVNRKQ